MLSLFAKSIKNTSTVTSKLVRDYQIDVTKSNLTQVLSQYRTSAAFIAAKKDGHISAYKLEKFDAKSVDIALKQVLAGKCSTLLDAMYAKNTTLEEIIESDPTTLEAYIQSGATTSLHDFTNNAPSMGR